MRSSLVRLGPIAPLALLLACSAGSTNQTSSGQGGGSSTNQSSSSSGSGAGGMSSASTAAGTGGGLDFDGGATGSGGGMASCNSGPNDDQDKDGFTVAQGDCNDCDANVNPNAVEVIATPDADGGVPTAADEDCDGKVDNVASTCDDMLNDVAEPNPMGGAWAVELCKKSAGPNSWGVSEAHWVLPDGSPPPAGFGAQFELGHGVVSGFGPNVKVQAGKRMLALSSGTARQPSDPGYMAVSGFNKGYSSPNPMGFPKESPACPGVVTGQPHDGAGLELSIRTPSNAHGFTFDFDFFTYEWPNFICSQYNDFFVAILSPIPMGQQDGNISFDSQGNPVSVNNAFLDVCGCDLGPPCLAGGKNFPCALGDQGLMGTGFGKDGQGGSDHASTYWLATKAPITPNTQIILRWGVYDSGDGVLDTTTLVDNFQWIASSGTVVGTGQIPAPK